MDSTPPARTSSSQPDRTFCAAMFTASRPDAQKRLICTPPVVTGMPDAVTAVRAMSAPGRDRADHTEDQVGDAVLVQIGGETNAQFVDQAGDQGDRLDRMQRPGLLAAAARSSDGFIDECSVVTVRGGSFPCFRM